MENQRPPPLTEQNFLDPALSSGPRHQAFPRRGLPAPFPSDSSPEETPEHLCSRAFTRDACPAPPTAPSKRFKPPSLQDPRKCYSLDVTSPSTLCSPWPLVPLFKRTCRYLLRRVRADIPTLSSQTLSRTDQPHTKTWSLGSPSSGPPLSAHAPQASPVVPPSENLPFSGGAAHPT